MPSPKLKGVAVTTIAELVPQGIRTVKTCTPFGLGFVATVTGLPGCVISPVVLAKGQEVIVRGYPGETFARHCVPIRSPD